MKKKKTKEKGIVKGAPSAVLLSLAIHAGLWCCLVSPAVAVGQPTKLNFNLDWRFVKQDVPGAERSSFDDSAWKRVSAPHTYNDIDTFDDMSPAGHMGEMNQWGGRTWYRKTFTVPAAWTNKTVMIEFESVRQVAEVYCNGTFVVKCENGFVPFGAVLDDHVRYGEDNVIAVMCDNTFVKDTEGDRKKIWHDYSGGAKFPWNNPHWHPAHGGIYRNVFLHVSDKLHFTQPLFNNMQTVGTYAYAIDPSRVSTGVGIEAEIANKTTSAQSFTLRSRLLDRDGQAVLEMVREAAVEAGETAIIKNTGTLLAPNLWEPKHPYVYTLENELVQDGVVVDVDRIPFGVRWAKFTRDRGFFINDRYVKLQGWGMKSVDGWPGLGAANSDWMHYSTLEMIAKAGGNFVRWGHTAGAPVHLKAADALGIVTQQPGVDGEGDVDGYAWDIRLAAWRDVVVYYRNHPSLLIWEGGNQSVSEPHVRALRDVVDTYDPHGGRAYGHRRADSTVEPYCDLTVSTEGSGFLRSLPTVEGEYNREESPRRVWDRQTPPYQDWHAIGSYDLTSEEYAIGQLHHYEKISAAGHCGGANWIFVDSTSGGRVETEVTRTSGEVDAMRLPKEAYHVCRVIFTDEPDLHIVGHWNYPAGTVKDIHVAADVDEVSLLLNDRELGRISAASEIIQPSEENNQIGQHPMLFTFPKVHWVPGTLVAIGYVNGKEVVRQELSTAGAPHVLRLTAITGPTGLLANGSDAAIFDVEAVDALGNRCPTFEQRCDFEMAGPGVWRGGYNSGKENSTNHEFVDLECGINRVIIRSALEAGTITLTAKTEGLKPATLSIDSVPVELSGGIAHHLPPLPGPPELEKLPVPVNPVAIAVDELDTVAGFKSAFFGDVSYSGPGARAHVLPTEEGAKLFTDDPLQIHSLPKRLKGGEFIQLPSADWNYSAVDLLQFSSLKDATVYVAHDARLPKLEWLKNGFSKTVDELEAGDRRWELFKKNVQQGESILIGSNAESHDGEQGSMLVIFSVIRK